MSWSNILTASQFNGYTGKTLAAVRNVKATIAAQNWFYAQCLATDDSLWVGRTPNRGGVWFFSNVGTVSATDVAFGFAVSQHDALKCWSCGADGVLKGSTDGAVSFSTLYTKSGAAKPIAAIEVPYANNPNDQTIYISCQGGENLASGVTMSDVHAVSSGYVISRFKWYGQNGNAHWHWDMTGLSGYSGPIEADIYVYSGGGSERMIHFLKSWGTPLNNDGSYVQFDPPPALMTITASKLNNAGDLMMQQWGHTGNVTAELRALRFNGVNVLVNSLPWMEKSTDGASTFSDVTPSEGGSSAFCSMEVATQDGQTIYTLVRADDTEEHHAVLSDDGAGSWTEKSDFNSIAI